MPSLQQAPGVSARFLGLLAREPLDRSRILDVGCGAGRLSLALAPAAKSVVGLDREASLIQEARRRAADAHLANVEFHEADVEVDFYERWRPDLVTAHLCASDAIIERAARALVPGACLAMVSFHVDQWKETGKVSRFAYDESRMRIALESHGFAVEALEVERGGRSYSVDTLRAIAPRLAPERPIFLIGHDAFALMDTWRDPEAIFALAHLAVMVRPGASPGIGGSLSEWIPKRLRDDVALAPDGRSALHHAGTWIRRIEIAGLDVSASELRARLRKGLSLRYLLPEPVRLAVEQSGVYGSS